MAHLLAFKAMKAIGPSRILKVARNPNIFMKKATNKLRAYVPNAQQLIRAGSNRLPNIQQMLRQNATAMSIAVANQMWMRLTPNQKMAILRGARLIQ